VERCLRICLEYGFEFHKAGCLLTLAHIRAATGDWFACSSHFNDALKAIQATQMTDPDIANTARLCGELAQKAGKTSIAKACFDLACTQLRELGRIGEAEALEARNQGSKPTNMS
jgi:hypothetical protein